MPELRPSSAADRANHLHINTHMRTNGTEILLPDDLLEGAGDLIYLNRNNNPLTPDGEEAFQLVGPENPDGWSPYVGTSREGVNGPTKQVSTSFPIARNSWMGNQPLFAGDPPPDLLRAYPIPRPEAPILVAESTGIEGYIASTLSSPYFAAITYIINGRHSLLSPWAPVPPVSNGQSIRVQLFEDIPEGVTHLGVWLTEPGTSTSSTPGPGRLQREVSVDRFNPGFYELTGPYRYGKKETTANETELSAPDAAVMRFRTVSLPAKPGQYIARVVWADANGESLPGGYSSPITISESSFYETFDDEGNSEGSIAGRGELQIQRPSNPPPGATGWRAYIYNEGQWGVAYKSLTQVGNEVPIPLTTSMVACSGWSGAGDNDLTARLIDFLVSRELPVENTSGIEAPEEAIEEPVVFGVVRPPAGTYYAGITESVRGRESILSPTSSITLTGNEILRVIRQDRVNRIPNGDNVELGASGLPLDQTTISTGGSVYVESASPPTVVLSTSSGTSGTTPSNTTRAVKVDRNKNWRVEVEIGAENPATGLFSGNAEVVLEEINASGSVTQTVLTTLSSVGRTRVDKKIYAYGTTGLPGGSVVWQGTTEKAQVLVRYSGTTKNMNIRIYYRILYDKKHKPTKRKRGPWEIGDFNAPDSLDVPQDDTDEPELPPGDDSGAAIPEEQPPPPEPVSGGGLDVVAYPIPDRPVSAGNLLETKHTFEASFPAGWTQHISSGATLTRISGSSLTGAGYMRSYKAS